MPAIIASAESKLVAGLSPEAAHACRDPLLTIAARVVPGYGEAAVAGWVASLLASFQRFPADLVVRHIRNAQYVQFKFINEVGPHVEEHIRADVSRRLRAYQRLKMLDMHARRARQMPSSDDRIDIANKLKALAAKMASSQDGDGKGVEQ